MRAPKKGSLPILPQRINGKLKFAYCFSCASEDRRACCTHTDEERDFDGTWATPELELALKNGYKIVRCYEVCIL